MLLWGFLHKLSTNFPDRRANNIKCSATLELRSLIWTTSQPNMSINLRSGSSSAWYRLARAAEVMWCDWLVAYWELKRPTRVSKLSMRLPWGTQERLDIRLRRHQFRGWPEWEMHPSARLGWWSRCSAPGWVISDLEVGQPSDSIDERMLSSHPSFRLVWVRGIVLIHGIIGLSGVWLSVGVLLIVWAECSSP